MNHVFVNVSKEENDIYPPTISKIATNQRRSRVYKPYFKNKPFKKKDKKISLKVIDDTDVIVYKGRHLVIPGADM